MATTDCQVALEREFKLIGDRVLDLSEEGMLVMSHRSAGVGDEVIVSLRVPGTRYWVDGEAVVMRVVHGRRFADRGMALGLRFTRMDAPAQAVLRGSLQRCVRPVPARPLRRDYAQTILEIGRAAPVP